MSSISMFVEFKNQNRNLITAVVYLKFGVFGNAFIQILSKSLDEKFNTTFHVWS